MLDFFRASFQPYPGYAVYARPEDHRISKRNLNKMYNWVGLVPDIFEFLAESYNFTYDLFESRDGAWGSYNPATGQWSGIIRDLIEDVADIGPAPLMIKEERTKVIDFIMPFFVDGSTFAISRQTAFNNGYVTAFTNEIWMLLLAITFLVASVLALVVRYGKELKHSDFKFEHCFIFTAQNFCGFGKKGWFSIPVNVSTRYEIL